MNTSILCVLLAVFSCALVEGDKGTCPNQMNDFVGCLQKKFKDNKDADDKKKEEMKDRVSKCFKDAKCQEPDFDAESKGMGKGIGNAMSNTPDAVKECMKKEMKKKMLEMLNKCLKDKNIKPIGDSEVDPIDVFNDNKMGADEDERKKMMKTVMNIGVALKQCRKDSGDEAAKKVRDCMKPIRQEIKTEICKRVNDCKKDKLTDEACKKRAQEVKDGSCQCMKDKIKEALKKVEELQKRGTDVEMSEVKDMMGPGAGSMEENMDKAEKCYKDNNQPVPPIFSLLKAGNQGGGLLSLFKPKISQEQLQDIHDMLQDKYDEPCGCSQN